MATCCEFATGLHMVGGGMCALLGMRAETVRKWIREMQWKRWSHYNVMQNALKQLPSIPTRRSSNTSLTIMIP